MSKKCTLECLCAVYPCSIHKRLRETNRLCGAMFDRRRDQIMKKILNRPEDYVLEMLEGLCAAHPAFFKRRGTEGRVLARPEAPISGKVGIVTGGGSGHLPVF